ncbi:hypothetical protein [Stenotrophomonas sp. YIM B06876]|uniref:hypothetical protein n=1 Tax=Stenotrophomonas sp. YIM B06876 TaxID=3060211 RepID=UPI00273955FD|nr:hypothetical protein [Stenotrophomonas sp. YIM B06876]
MTATHDPALDALYADLEALRVAVEEEEHDLAARILDNHDRRLRHYVDGINGQSPVASLQGLLKLQQTLMADMLTRRDIAGARLRAGRQSVRAANAYHLAESLA